jgi:transposase InsO family protein
LLAVAVSVDSGDREWLVEQRYRAVLEVLDGSPVGEVAVRYGVSRQAVHAWKGKYLTGGIEALREASRRPRSSPTRVPAEVEALVCEMRRANPRWGARRITFELGQAGVPSPPSRATVHRILVRNGLVRAQRQEHRRKYRRWQREAPMHLWQLDLVGGVFLADGRECKMLTGIDDHSRFVVVAAVLAVPAARAVADAFLKAMRVYGVPSEVLTDNGKQFTGRFTKPRPAEVLFERVCRENGITARLTKPYSPTTTGKIERWHQTLRRELLDPAGPFVDLPSAQAAISAWVHTYNHARPHQSLDMAIPASLFRPNAQPEPLVLTAQLHAPGNQEAAEAVPTTATTETSGADSGLVLLPSAGAVEFDTVIAASGTQTLRVACAIRPVGCRCGRYELGRRGGYSHRVPGPGLGVFLTASARGGPTAPLSRRGTDLRRLEPSQISIGDHTPVEDGAVEMGEPVEQHRRRHARQRPMINRTDVTRLTRGPAEHGESCAGDPPLRRSQFGAYVALSR